MVGKKDDELKVLEHEALTEILTDQFKTITTLQERLDKLEAPKRSGNVNPNG